MKLTYLQTLEYLLAQLPMFHRIGPAAFKKDLTNTLALCEHLGNPHKKFSSVHIAGTNGKGSVAHMVAAIFTACGMKTGLYTSPHYRDFRERIKINGELIPKKEVVSFVKKHKPVFEAIKPSFFEWTVALAFDCFAREKVDVAVIETGLGGRLDSTNVIHPLLSIITNIGFDHQQFLGATLPEIAAEKAGIIKPGVPVVIGETNLETADVFRKKAKEAAAPIFFADRQFQAVLLEKDSTHSTFRAEKLGENKPFLLRLNHLADYQARNLPTVLQAMEVLASTGFLPENHDACLRKGLENLKKLTGFMGRWEVLSHHPTLLLDSAHNEDGIRAAIEGIEKMKFDRLHFVFGTVSDKSLDKVLPLLPKNATYYFAKADIPRGKDAGELKLEAAKFGLKGKAYSSVPKALAAARLTASPEDLIFVGGSIFVVAEVV